MLRFPYPLILMLVACDSGVVADDFKGTPPDEVIQRRVGDWSALEPAVGRRPADSGMLTKGPIVTDLHALTGEDAIVFRTLLNEQGGPLTRDGKLLVTASPPGPDAIYLVVDTEQRALEAGRKVDGKWVVKKTAAAEIARPVTVQALYDD